MPNLHQILLRPTDVLFFRDGRPMSGSLAGHTAAWPLPDMTNHALHAALHRAELPEVHNHRRGRSGEYSQDASHRDRKFGSLLTAGPFPVDTQNRWFFPRPKDAQSKSSTAVTHFPVHSLSGSDPWLYSSLPEPLEYAIGSQLAPSKESSCEDWISKMAFESYLRTAPMELAEQEFLNDDLLADREQQIGIAIDAETGTAGRGDASGKLYSAYYLRLRERFRLGLLAQAEDKGNGQAHERRDLLGELLNGDDPLSIVVGGQQRVCSATRSDSAGSIPMPSGLSEGADFAQLRSGGFAVKWILLSPSIWPEMAGEDLIPHPGGWLPNWADPTTGEVLLKSGETSRTKGEARTAWRTRVRQMPSIHAKLVAALLPKPVVVTGWALPNELKPAGGAKPTHLAVPAGAIYYFEADSRESAARLAAALNWHGNTRGSEIRNRRSTLLGEKGYGLGVCGTWNFFADVGGRPKS